MVQAVRGMRDILPAAARRWRSVETLVQNVLRGYAYDEIQLPLLEYTELFARGVGEATDIVEKEMYALLDRDGDSLSLRPEGTASCVRALQENGLLYNQTQRVFYAGPMFRYEKPQKGRYRQFYQIGAEAFGFAGPDIDAELIVLGAEFWRALGLTNHVRLEINTLGSSEARQAYKDALVNYLTPLRAQLDADSQRRLTSNPLRILDSKEAATQAVLVNAPKLPDFVDADSRAHFQGLMELLDGCGIEYVANPNLVRGLDYYTHTVFEWMTDDLGAQGTVCAGGRYNGLVEKLGGKPTPAAGFALGLDRVLLLHEVVHQDNAGQAAQVYVCYSPAHTQSAFALVKKLRELLPDTQIRLHMGGGALKKQFKRADQAGADCAVLLGDQEVEAGAVTVKQLQTGDQSTLGIEDAVALIRSILARI